MRFVMLISSLFLFNACSLKSNSSANSTVSFRVPTVAEFDAASSAMSKSSGSTVSTLAISASDLVASKACFMINVTAPDIISASANSCQISSGVFFGSVPPGTSNLVSFDVPKGENRKFEVLAYFRHNTTDTCDKHPNVNDFDANRTALLGTLKNVTLEKDIENLSISISMPTQTIAAQYSLPASCGLAGAPTGANFSRGVSGSLRATTLTSGYITKTSVGTMSDKRVSMTPNGFKVWRKRGAINP